MVVDLDVACRATLADPRADADRCMRAAGVAAARLDLAARAHLPAVLRDSGWSLRARVRDGELIGFAPRRQPARSGLAVDLGTTNVAAFLVDLESGARLASLGIENPQVAWGADLISRINHATAHAAAARNCARPPSPRSMPWRTTCARPSARTRDIVDVAVCGNTAMHHLLLGPAGAPARPRALRGRRARRVDVRRANWGWRSAPGAYVHLAPNVGGFVGGDHVTALLATEERWRDAPPAW